MNKSEAIAHMISKVEEIERERLAAHFSIDATKQKKERIVMVMRQNLKDSLLLYRLHILEEF